MRVRFAPSPTGYLHVGGARTALFNWLLAKRSGGDFLLRIEDTDRRRGEEAHVKAILEGLRWLGIDWDLGPIRQSDGIERHRAVARRLVERGRAYFDLTPPEELDELRKAHIAEGEGSTARLPRVLASRIPPEEAERRALAGERCAIRLRVPEGETRWSDLIHGEMSFANEEIEDFVLLRADGGPTYNLAAAADDHEGKITHVVRGDDHLSNTPKQLLLYRAMGWSEPRFGHLPLILGPDGRRLSKRHGAVAVGRYREEGILADAMVNFLALLGWSDGSGREIFSRDELLQAFSLERVLKKGSVFDVQKLQWMNGRYLARMRPEELVERLRRAHGDGAESLGEEELARLAELIAPRSRTLRELEDQAEPFMREIGEYDAKGVRKLWKRPGRSSELLLRAEERLRGLPFREEVLEERLRALATELSVGAGKLFQNLRLALTGRTASPGIFDVLCLLGKDRALARIGRARSFLSVRARAEAEGGAGG